MTLYSGKGASGADTAGGEVVVINGVNFGPASLPSGALLDAIGDVTYGPILGTEYTTLIGCFNGINRGCRMVLGT